MQLLDEFRESLLQAAPEAADSWEIAALSESLGLTDGVARKLGYDNIFDFADVVFAENYQNQTSRPIPTETLSLVHRVNKELLCAGSKICTGFAYSLPWILFTAAENLYPKTLEVPPALGSAFCLSIISSLITTGGIAQAITREATFYLALKEPQLARRSLTRLMGYGMTIAVSIVFCAILLCLYFNLFPLRYVVLASIHYLLFCFLWMLCALLSAQGLSFVLPMVLVGSAGATLAGRLVWHVDSVPLLLFWPVLASVMALVCAGVKAFITEHRLKHKANSRAPHEAIRNYMLLPLALYGTAYFSFIFADRLCAGSAVSWTSGLTFGVDPVYKQAMDIALFAFLLSSIGVEYLSDVFMRSWWTLASAAQQTATATLSTSLRRYYSLAIISIALTFALIVVLSFKYLPIYLGIHRSFPLTETIVLGGLGYLFLSVSLFGSIVLLSVNAAVDVYRAAGWGLLTNLLVGYTLSHAIAVQFAALGLVVGALIFLWRIHLSVWGVLAKPAYHYSLV